MSSRTAWSTYQASRQPGTHRETLSQNKKKMLNEKLLLGTPVHTQEALKESVHIEQDRNLEDCRTFLLYSIYLK